MEIEEEIYKNLYKANFKTMPKQRILTICEKFPGLMLDNLLKASVLVDENDIDCDYDCDAEDLSWHDAWKKEHSKNTLTVEKFEKTMEFLEKHFQAQVPRLEMLMEEKITKRRETEAIYDYWQEKRLKNGRKLNPQVKRLEKLGSYDPYVAFRSWFPEKVKTRKTKAADRSNYVKLLKVRSLLRNDLQDLEQKKNSDIQAHKTLVYKLQEFYAQYKSHCFSDEFLQWTNWPQTDTEVQFFAQMKPAVPIEESSDDDDDLKPLTEVEFPFNPKAGSNYLMPVEPNIIEDDRGFSPIFPCNLIRRRVGSGGRIVVDREVGRYDCMNNTFKEMQMIPAVHCSKFKFMPEQGNSCSVFKLQDTGRDENIEYN